MTLSHVPPRICLALIFALALRGHGWGAENGNTKPVETGSDKTVEQLVEQLNVQFADQWKSSNVHPAARVDDAGFMRRVYLDLIGHLPTADEAKKFLDDSSTTKRERLIEALLADPRYATRWADYWDALLMGRVFESATVDRRAFHHWLEQKFQSNVAWSTVVRELITAEGINTSGMGYRQPEASKKDEDKKVADNINPAVNWTIHHAESLPDLSASASRIFLGVQLQCAQCHDHKTEKWTKQDFRQFTAFFAKTWALPHNYGMRSPSQISLIQLDLRDRLISPPTGGKAEQFFGSYKDYVGLTPKTLDGQTASVWKNRRQVLADWMTSPSNPWFAQAFVNRLWHELLGVGFVDPVDDFRPGNPAVMPAALDLLAHDFAAHRFDVHRLLKIITQSKPYQQACHRPAKNSPRNGHWSCYPVKPLSIEVLFDSVAQATGAEQALRRHGEGKLELIRGAFVQQFVIQMGNDEMTETGSHEETIARALLQMNGALFSGAVQSGNRLTLDQVWQSATDDAGRIERLYLTTLSRRPTAAEQKFWRAFLAEPRSVVKSPSPASKSPYRVQGLSALMTSPEIRNAGKDADFRELLKHARTAADFAALAKRMNNLVDAGIYVRALREFAAEAPFQALAENGGGTSTTAQAYEDMFWALVNSSEFLNNH